MSKKVQISVTQPKSKKQISEVLMQMEKIVENKLAAQKIFAPILLTIITSIITFLFVHSWGNDVDTARLYIIAFVYALVCFGALITMLFGKSDYKAIEKKTTKLFQPHILSSYCFLSDAIFVGKFSIYAGRKLSYLERLRVNCLKQKINEYAYKDNKLKTVLTVILVGTAILLVMCLLGLCFLPQMLQLNGEAV